MNQLHPKGLGIKQISLRLIVFLKPPNLKAHYLGSLDAQLFDGLNSCSCIRFLSGSFPLQLASQRRMRWKSCYLASYLVCLLLPIYLCLSTI